MLEQQSRYDTARENKQKKEARTKKKKSFPSDYCVVLKLGGSILCQSADERPPPPVPCTYMHDQCAHSATRAYFGVCGTLAELLIGTGGSIRLSGSLCDAFLCRWGGETEKKDQDPASWTFPPPPTNSCVRVPSHPYCAILLCSRYPYASQGRYRTIQCFVVKPT